MTMTVDDVKEMVANIAILAGDAEAAHSAEDDLHQDVLRAIANGDCDDPKSCAAEALKTLDIKFERWCA